MVKAHDIIMWHTAAMKNARVWRTIVLPAVLLSTCLVFAQTDSGTIDHVRIIVRDIQASKKQYRDVLGFNLPYPDVSVFDEGSAHDGTDLSDHTYLELLGVADQEKLAKVRPWIIDFLKRYEGLHSVGLLVTSAQKASDGLRVRGIDAPMFQLISKAGKQPILLVTPKMANLPQGSIFFLEYPAASLKKIMSAEPVVQPNTSLGILAVWIAVKDISKAGVDVEALGFHRGRTFESKTLGAGAQEFDTDHGKIILLQAADKDGPVAQFINQREGVMGMTLEVSDLSKARELIEKHVGQTLTEYDGFYGKSFLVPSKFASEAWIEMVKK